MIKDYRIQARLTKEERDALDFLLETLLRQTHSGIEITESDAVRYAIVETARKVREEDGS